MCTVTWVDLENGYQVFFNRDERRTRQPALPPEPRAHGGMRYLAPADGDFGGSWLAVNEVGLTLALLNGYAAGDEEAAAPVGGFLSRGLLPLSLIACDSATTAMEHLRLEPLDRYRSFLLIAFESRGRPSLARWTGGGLSVDSTLDAGAPLVSSSFDTDEVRSRRTELFRRMKQEWTGSETALHLAYHSSHLPARGAYSPCMHRPDARTVSLSRVRVEPSRIAFDYRTDSPCRARFVDGNRDWTASVALVTS
jgi:hypothetical protein